MTTRSTESTSRSLLEILAEEEQRAASKPSSPVVEVRIDLDRKSRCGFPEVIYAPGKTASALRSGVQTLIDRGQSVLVTRCEADVAETLTQTFPQLTHNPLARTVRWNANNQTWGRVMVVSAGTSDRPVAEEAVETLRWMDVDVGLLMDVGVAGPQRFLEQKDQLSGAQAIVVVAGMEGALPSVVAGWVSCPVIAVPTSVGYGAAFGGASALLGMLNSCAANVAVVNIDAGFKGAYLAGMIARQSAIRTEGN